MKETSPDISDFFKDDPQIISISQRDRVITIQERDINRNRDYVLLDSLHHPEETRDANPLFWDYLFDRITVPTIIDLSFRKVDVQGEGFEKAVFFEIERLDGLSSLTERKLGGETKDTASRKLSGSKEFLADYARKRWEEWLEKSQSWPTFEYSFKITSGKEAPGIAQYIGAELSNFGNFEIVQHSCDERDRFLETMKDGRIDLNIFETVSLEKIKYGPRGRNRAAWEKLTHLRTILHGDAAKEILRLPIPDTGYLKTFPLESELQKEAETDNENSVRLGKIPGRTKECLIPLTQLNKHLFVAGVTGSGKTTTLFELLVQLWDKHRIPFLVIESAKTEYRQLKNHPKLKKDLRVYTCGNDLISPFKMNPFEFDREIPLDEHLGNIEACFKGSLSLPQPLPEIIPMTIERAYEKKGWRLENLIHDPGLEFPAMKDLEKALQNVLDKYKYEKEIGQNIRTAGRVRLNSLTRRAIGRILSTNKSLPNIETLLSRPSVLELDRLNQEQANLITLFLLTFVREHIKKRAKKNKLQNILVVEEAHNLIGNIQGDVSHTDEGANPKAEAANFMIKMLAEVRALGLGIIIADQTPAGVAPEVIKNTGVKIVHRTVSGDDRECLAESMLLNAMQMEDLARLDPGQCFVYHEHFYHPVMTEVAMTEENRNLPYIDDRGLWDLLSEKKFRMLSEKWEKEIEKLERIERSKRLNESQMLPGDYRLKLEKDFFCPWPCKLEKRFVNKEKQILKRIKEAFE